MSELGQARIIAAHMRRVLVVAVLVAVMGGVAATPSRALAVAKIGPCVPPEEGRDYMPPSSPEDGLQNGATGVTNVVAVRVSKLNSYTAARFVGGEAEGKIGTWGASRRTTRHDASAWALDRNARRYDIQGVDVSVGQIGSRFGLRASDAGAEKARKCVRDAVSGQ